MTISGKTSNFSYVTVLELKKCTCEITSGMQRGVKRTAQWQFIDETPDEFVEVFDFRGIGWGFIFVWLLVGLAAFAKGNGRLDVALLGAPFCLLPFVLLQIFGRREYCHVVFRYLSGSEAFIIPQNIWKQGNVREYIQTNIEANKTVHSTPENAL